MPSPFPGMDPFIEIQEWESFHASFIIDIADALSPLVQPKYIARPQRRVYSEPFADEEPDVVIADAAVLRQTGSESFSRFESSDAAIAVAPVELTWRMGLAEPRQETYLTIRESQTQEVVTIIELLSPSNKRAGGIGRREYMTTRKIVLNSATHLVELDLLRGGRRLPTVEPLPPGDYYAFVSRSERRPRTEVYAWSIRQALPRVSIPLKSGDPDVPLDLQLLFTARYERARLSHSLDYSAPLKPPLKSSDAEWVRRILQS